MDAFGIILLVSVNAGKLAAEPCLRPWLCKSSVQLASYFLFNSFKVLARS